MFVGPDLDPNCLQRLSAEDKSCCWQGNSYYPRYIKDIVLVLSVRPSVRPHFLSVRNRVGVIKIVIVINCNLITFSKVIVCNCN